MADRDRAIAQHLALDQSQLAAYNDLWARCETVPDGAVGVGEVRSCRLRWGMARPRVSAHQPVATVPYAARPSHTSQTCKGTAAMCNLLLNRHASHSPPPRSSGTARPPCLRRFYLRTRPSRS